MQCYPSVSAPVAFSLLSLVLLKSELAAFLALESCYSHDFAVCDRISCIDDDVESDDDEEEENLFAKKAGCQKGLQPIDAGYQTRNKTKIDEIYTNITCWNN